MLIPGKDAEIIVEMHAAEPIPEDGQKFYLLGIAKLMAAIPAKANLIIIAIAFHSEGNVGQLSEVFESDLNALFDGVIHQLIIASGAQIIHLRRIPAGA